MALTALAIGAIAAPVIGGIAGSISASSSREQAAAAAQKAYDTAMSLGLPPDESKALILKQFQSAGVLTPELEQTINAGPSAMASVQEDPSTRNAQVSALQLMQQSGRTGLNPQDRAAMNSLRQQVATDTNSKQQQIQQTMNQRGMGGSGANLIAQLNAAQAGSNSEASQADQIASQASQRALQAIQNSSSMASQLRGQDFSNAEAKAKAADEMNRFNTSNAISTQQRNVASSNAAQAANLSNNQRISDANTAQANAESQRQAQAAQTYWNSLYQRTQLQANAALGQATNQQAQAQATQNLYSGIGSGAGQAFGSYANYLAKSPSSSSTGSTTSTGSTPAVTSDGSYTNSNFTLPEMGE